LRPLMPTPLTKTILNRWPHATPVHAASGRWVSYLSIDAAAVRAGPDRAATLRAAAVRDARTGLRLSAPPRSAMPGRGTESLTRPPPRRALAFRLRTGREDLALG